MRIVHLYEKTRAARSRLFPEGDARETMSYMPREKRRDEGFSARLKIIENYHNQEGGEQTSWPGARDISTGHSRDF